MKFKFYINYKLLKFFVSFNQYDISIEPVVPYKYNQEYSNLLAETNQLLAKFYLSRSNFPDDTYAQMVQYFIGRGWTIEECVKQGENVGEWWQLE